MRTFVEVRRRTKVIGRFPGQTSALSLIWALLELSSRGWRGVLMTPKTVAEIERLRHGADGSAEPPATNETEQVIAAKSQHTAEPRSGIFPGAWDATATGGPAACALLRVVHLGSERPVKEVHRDCCLVGSSRLRGPAEGGGDPLASPPETL